MKRFPVRRDGGDYAQGLDADTARVGGAVGKRLAVTVTATVLFGRPHASIAPLITSRISASTSTRIVSGFATPGGLGAIDAPIRAAPAKLRTLVVGAATYPAFQALDDLRAAHVATGALRIHLGHSSPANGKTHPFPRYHPMLHSKVYYMEMGAGSACAFIGSHNLTSFALSGHNSEAAVMLEGPVDAPQFEDVRRHMDTVEQEAVVYNPAEKESYAWWSKQYIAGLDAEVGLPRDWSTVRTILIFAANAEAQSLVVGDDIYFELPDGIQIESLRTEVHLYIFDLLPSTPREALVNRQSAQRKFKGITLGADNEQGNVEVRVKWRLEQTQTSILRLVPGSRYRPTTSSDMQQVRAKIQETIVRPLEYSFEREKTGWEPVLSPDLRLAPIQEMGNAIALREARGADRLTSGWRLVTGLEPRTGVAFESDQAALALARPEAGAFVLVPLRRRSSTHAPESGGKR